LRADSNRIELWRDRAEWKWRGKDGTGVLAKRGSARWVGGGREEGKDVARLLGKVKGRAGDGLLLGVEAWKLGRFD
jgi:hypothetical protein